MDTANNPYTFGMATGEIISLLLLTFVMGMLLCWLLRQMGLCCRTRKAKTTVRSVNFDLPTPMAKMAIPDVYVPKVKVQPKLVDLPDINLPKPSIDIPVREEPEIEIPKAELSPPEVKPDWWATIDPHKPIIDPPDMTLETGMDMELEPLPSTPSNRIDLPEIDPLLAAIDPHKPIIDPPDIDWETPLEAPTMPIEPLNVDLETPQHDPLLAAIDPHKPIIDPPDIDAPTEEAPINPNTTGSLFNDWLHKAKESVEHLTEKATPTTNEWLHKAKESVEHLTEKATPTTSEWLHKAKEIGNELSAKSSSLASSETLVKGSSTLAALAASAKELTEKLASNLSIKHDDLQKLAGIGPTFASVLHRAGIHTYEQLAETSTQKLQALLIVEDEQFSQHDTSSWPKQAALAAQGEWEQLKAYQDSL